MNSTEMKFKFPQFEIKDINVESYIVSKKSIVPNNLEKILDSQYNESKENPLEKNVKYIKRIKNLLKRNP